MNDPVPTSLPTKPTQPIHLPVHPHAGLSVRPCVRASMCPCVNLSMRPSQHSFVYPRSQAALHPCACAPIRVHACLPSRHLRRHDNNTLQVPGDASRSSRSLIPKWPCGLACMPKVRPHSIGTRTRIHARTPRLAMIWLISDLPDGSPCFFASGCFLSLVLLFCLRLSSSRSSYLLHRN